MNEAEAEQLVHKAVKLAGLKAVGVMMSTPLGKNCLSAAAVAAAILQHFKVPFTIVAGFTHMEGTTQSFPHVWLESPGGIVTDLTFSGPYRKVIILNWAVGFHDDAMRAVYTREPEYPVDASKSLPLDVLQFQASNISAYVARGPQHVKEAIGQALSKAFDGSDRLEIQGVSADLLAGAVMPQEHL
jgi:hypothetical protein